MTPSTQQTHPRILEIPSLSIGQTMFSWCLIILVPVLFLSVAVSRIIQEEEWAGRLSTERRLMAGMGEFIRDLEPTHALEHSLEQAERHLGLSFSNSRPLKAKTPLPELEPETFLPRFKQALSATFPAPPLLLTCIGADYETVAVHSDPRFFEERVAPSITAWRQLFFSLTKGQFRRPLVKNGMFNRLAGKFSSSEQKERLKDFSRKFLLSQFDDYFPGDLLEGQPVSFFSPRYGLGSLIVIFRTFAGSPGREEPFLGGYFLVVRDADIPRDFLLNSVAGNGRSWRRESVACAPSFRETPAGLEYVFPAPPGLFPLGTEASGTAQVTHLALCAPNEEFVPALVSWKPVLGFLALVWLGAGWFLLRHLHRGTLIIPWKISGQLRLGLILIVGLSLGALFLFSRSFEQLVRQKDEKQLFKQFELQLDLLESRAHEHLTQKIHRLWERKNSWVFSPTMPVAEIQRWLDEFMEQGSGAYVHLLCRDAEWIRTRSAAEGNAFSVPLLKRVGETLRILALHQMISFDDIHLRQGENLPRVAEHRWGKDILTLAHKQILMGEMPYLMRMDAQSLDIRLTGLQEGKVAQFQIRGETGKGNQTLEAVLFFILRPEEALDSFFCQRWERQEGFLPSSQQQPFKIAVFGVGPRGIEAGRCWPPSAAMDPGLRQLAQMGADNPRGGALSVGKPTLGMVRMLRNLPYVLVCQADESLSSLPGAAMGWEWPVLTLVWLLSLVGLASRFLARGFLLPIQRLVEAGAEVSRGNFQRVLAEEQSGPEFLAIGQEFNRMNQGLREGRLLARFVSSQATTAGRSGGMGSQALELGGERRMVVVMFSHISDFVRVTANLNPDQIMDLLSRYFSVMEPVIEAHGGMIDKYIGDAIMAVFPADAPEEQATRPIEAALAMRRALQVFNRETVPPFPRIQSGIGMAEGEVIAGRIGSRARRLDYTVIGDVVNLAARLEALRDRLPAGAIILNQTLASRLENQYAVNKAGNLAIKGKSQDVPVFFLSAESGQ